MPGLSLNGNVHAISVSQMFRELMDVGADATHAPIGIPLPSDGHLHLPQGVLRIRPTHYAVQIGGDFGNPKCSVIETAAARLAYGV
jgi:hypothetical protein